MGFRRLSIDQFRVGEPLPFDAYDEHGHLLMAGGCVVETQEQLERLIERGLFSEGLR